MHKRLLPTKESVGVNLQPQEFVFVREYLKDFNQRRAAKLAGVRGDVAANEMLGRPNVEHALGVLLRQQLDLAGVDVHWLLEELVDNHMLARQDGKINASNQALGLIAKLNVVDAFAAEKFQVSTAADVVDRLQRARSRLQPGEQQQPVEEEVPSFY